MAERKKWKILLYVGIACIAAGWVIARIGWLVVSFWPIIPGVIIGLIFIVAGRIARKSENQPKAS